MLSQVQSQSPLVVSSPDGRLQVTVQTKDYLALYATYDSVPVTGEVRFSMNLNDDEVLGLKPVVRRKALKTIRDTLFPVVKEKFARVIDHCSELWLQFKGHYGLRVRVYNSGVAWRFETMFNEDITVNREQVSITFPDSSFVWFPEEESFFSHNERYYLYEQVNLISADRFCSLPALVQTGEGLNVVVMESGLSDYPGMWLKGTGTNMLRARFPGVALEEEQESDRNVKVTRYADYIALTRGTRTFPWRILAVSDNDRELLTNQLVWLLGGDCEIDDPSWIKPGKVAWDWWNDLNIFGVDFKAGVNTETYKYYIDFAAANGIEYIIMDEGWYELGNLLKVNPEVDMEEILSDASSRNVGVILWVVWKTLDSQWDTAFAQFEKWGIAGLKVDFMQRDDQWMVGFYERVAREAARRNMLVDFHGSYKPAGLRKRFPNVLTREGVAGQEHVKWSDLNTPEHHLTIPFIRMVPGPMDFTPGAMRNANPKNFAPLYSRPMSMGTRCHQLAMYLVYESPLQMLCDNPSNYMADAGVMSFLSNVPVVWDTTIVIDAVVGDLVVVARKSGNNWYVGALTDNSPRDLTIPLLFLDGNEKYDVTVWQDGMNAERMAEDYTVSGFTAVRNDNLKVHMAPGGGWVARLIPSGR
ncbi:MAG: glycoside hydrolase family 97 protein [Bacteroidales bacterium]